jgi:Na+/H+ antiporter NhaA
MPRRQRNPRHRRWPVYRQADRRFRQRLSLCSAGWARLPEGVGLATLYAVALLARIGFTVSLFIGTADYAVPLRLGVLSGSLLAGVGGYIVLRAATRPLPANL